MTRKEPSRLLENTGLAETLRAAKERLPTDEAVARISAGVDFALTSARPPAGRLAPASGAPVSALKIAATALAIGSTGAALLFALTRAPSVPALPPAREPTGLPFRTLDVRKDAQPDAESSSAPVAFVRSSPGVAVPTELELVGKAERGLRSDPARALALSEEHRRLYPRGELSEERDVLTIEALSALGREREARAKADRFRSTHPSSPYFGRISRALGAGSSADGSVHDKKNEAVGH